MKFQPLVLLAQLLFYPLKLTLIAAIISRYSSNALVYASYLQIYWQDCGQYHRDGVCCPFFINCSSLYLTIDVQLMQVSATFVLELI